MSVLLCVCLLLVSLPTEFYGGEVQAEGPRQKILSFSDLPAEVRYQTVEVGTSERKLNLPDTLTAVCISLGNESTMGIENIETMSQLEHSSRVKGTDGQEAVLHEEHQDSSSQGEAPQENRLEEVEEYPADGSRMDAAEQFESPTDSGVDRVEFPEIVPEDGSTERNFEETVVIENITWMSAPTYDSETEGVYDFLPVLPEEYMLADGVELPEIQVEVGDREATEEGKERRKLDSKEVGKKEADSGVESIEYFAPSARESQVISEDTTWDENRILSSGELVINEGVTLTMNSYALVNGGNVIIRGGGTIVRGNPYGTISVQSGGSLTVLDVTVDGNSIDSSQPMLRAYKGNLTLDGGCRIQNCRSVSTNAGTGGAVDLQYSTVTFNDCVIENCEVSRFGGAVKCSSGTILTINGGTYRNNRTTSLKSEDIECGGGFLMCAGSKVYIYGDNFIGNTTVGKGGAIYQDGSSTYSPHRKYIYMGERFRGIHLVGKNMQAVEASGFFLG